MINYIPVECLHKSETGSIVLKVREKDRGNFYALKFIGPLNDNLKNLIFKREVNALKILNKYDDIVKIYDSDTHMRLKNKRHLGGILLEFVEGKTLDQVDLSELSDLKKQDLCLKILRAIANAHKNSIIHRDIKPDNIIYLNGKIKIIDFGSSKIKTIIEKETTVPMFSHVYSAPEVVAGGETTEASDIYSLGAVFFKILLNLQPISNSKMVEIIEKSILNGDIKLLLLEMLHIDPNERLSDISHAITVFENRIGELNVNTHKFCFSVDSYKLRNLKKEYVVEENMTMAQFTDVFLLKDFQNMHGMYDAISNSYKFVGNQLCMECVFNYGKALFEVVKIYEISIDRRIKMQKLFCNIEGRFIFINLLASDIPRNNNRQLRVILSNYSDEIKSLENKSVLFDKLFGNWKQSLYDCIDNTKSKNGKLIYKDYHIENNILTLTIREYQNNSIDNIDSNMKYIFENTEQGRIKTYSIGSFDDAVLVSNEIQFKIKLDSRNKLSKIKLFLDEKKEILEDYNFKIMSYRRQIAAITALQNDECMSRNLKDIILELEEPTYTPNIKTLEYYSEVLNDSQKHAVDKSIFSDSISLIQGPPGTGKTTVINEILNQIVLKPDKFSESSRILVVSQSHAAVDNILEGLNLEGKNNLRVVRIGDKKNVTAEIADKYMIEAIRENLFSSVKENSMRYLSHKLKMHGIEQEVINSDNYEINKWLKIKEIQEEWIKRCGDYETLDYQLINSASIIAGTCVGFLSNEFVRDMYFDYVIVDEAAKATTPELLVSIIKAKKIILVGDQKQLPPFADNNLSKLLMELTKNPEYRLFDILFDILPDTHKQILTTQYRMIKNIGDLISLTFYDGIINTGIDDEKRRHNIPYYGNNSIVWFNTSKLNERFQRKIKKGGSYINVTENKIIKFILSKMNELDNAKDLDVGIITGYRAQKDLIKKSVNNSNFSNIGKIIINTLDAFQGRENDIIIYSTVRTSKSIGFQKEKERINVAFSRAKKLLIVCGDLDFFYAWDDGENKYVEVINYIRENTQKCAIIDLSEGDFNE